MRFLVTLIGSIAVVATVLILVVGLFWTIDLAPLLLFIGGGATYVVISSRQNRVESSSHSKMQLAGPPHSDENPTGPKTKSL
jgi:hypothetical protein